MMKITLLPVFVACTMLLTTSCSDDYTVAAQETPSPTPTATQTAQPSSSPTPIPKLTWSNGGQSLFMTHCSCHDVLKSSLDSVKQKKADIISRINTTNSALVMPKPGTANANWASDKSKMVEFLSSSVIE